MRLNTPWSERRTVSQDHRAGMNVCALFAPPRGSPRPPRPSLRPYALRYDPGLGLRDVDRDGHRLSGGAVAFILFVPQPTGAIVGVIWLLMGGGFVFFSIRALRGRKDDERIRREGTPATATLLTANTTGMLINNVPQWELRLRIDGAGASYEATMK